MSWKGLGRIYVPDGSKDWARSHAALPTPVQIGSDRFRFFYSARDDRKRSHVGWADVDFAGELRVEREGAEPALWPGPDGTFDDSGVGIGCIVRVNEAFRLYYMGWNLGVTAPWRNAIGLAEAPAALDRFEKFSPGPILDRSPQDPYTLSYPCVVRVADRDWRMWYGSNLAPFRSNADMTHAIKLARSADGIEWTRDGAVALGFSGPQEYAQARPTVIKLGSVWLMCFACRGERYTIGAAWSTDGLSWTRIDREMGLAPSATGWDSEMTCYPALFEHRGGLYLAYNGNGYGATGFGLAVWDGSYPFG